MLRELRVANLALVDDLVIGFSEGMTILTGETGAGKSLIAGALNLLAGGKGDKRLIREGEELAIVEGVFDLSDRPRELAAFADAGLRIGSDGLLVMRRELKREGRGRVLINGLISSLSIFERLGPGLLSVQSQDQQRMLSRPSFAGHFLDQALELDAELESMAGWVTRYREVQRELDERTLEQDFAHQQLEMWEFQYRELHDANLSVQDEANVREKLNFGRNVRSLLEGSETGLLDLCDGETNARLLLARTLKNLEPLAAGSPRLESILDLIRDAENLITEAGIDLQRFSDTVNIEPAELDILESRQHLYSQLQRKFSRDVEGLIELEKSLKQRIDRQRNAVSDMDDLRAELDEISNRMAAAALVLRGRRQAGAAALANRAEELIQPLALPELKLEFSIEPDLSPSGGVDIAGSKCHINERGADRIVLMARTNRGESWNSVGAVASGGEKSRIFLGLSVLGAENSVAPLQLFDEIDAGLGMDNAIPVARLLRRLSRRGQVLCITHLATVAALGHSHLRVHKSIEEGRTTVSVETLAGSRRVDELARLLGGESNLGDSRDAQVAYAKQLLSQGEASA